MATLGSSSTKTFRSMRGLVLLGTVVACSGGGQTSTAPGIETGRVRQQVTGNVHPAAIQIDGPALGPPGADLYANVGTPLNAGATADWVVDDAAHSGTGCLGADAIATCVEPGITGASGGSGHWNGARIVDGIGSADADMFLTGGKEDEFATWNIGAGSIGSSKYDITQAYLANNQSTLFFGMERRGTNGTTAFDFEFNQLAPGSGSCPQNSLIPCRSEHDVLFVFELQGSGNTGSAKPHIFTWDGASYTEGAPAGLVVSINDSESTAGGPWGHVDSRGNWVLGNLERFAFGEAAAPISVLPGVNACGGKAFVQVRTRSSVSETSDLKDTTKVFEYEFLNLKATATLTPSCEQKFAYSAVGEDADGKALANPTCHWTFSNGATSETCSGFVSADPGTYTGTVEISDASVPGCKASNTSAPVHVYAPLSVKTKVDATCENSFTFGATPSGGSNAGGVSYAWTFSGGGSVTPASSNAASGTVAVGTPAVSYTGSVIVTDPRTDISCTASDQASATPYAPLHVDLTLTGSGATCPGIASDAVSYAPSPSGGNGAYSYTWNGATCSGASCTVDPAEATYCHDQTLSVTVMDGSGLCAAATSEPETYTKVTTVTASDNP